MRVSKRQAEQWDRFASTNAEYYILTDSRLKQPTDDGHQRFLESGRRQSEMTLGRVKARLTRWESALEIGCGSGRLTLPHARRFQRVCAVDVSPQMLDKLQRNLSDEGLTNVVGLLPRDPWDAPGAYDYVYSFLVFQHIPDFDTIRRYVVGIARSLHPDGLAQLQFDTRKRSPRYRLRNVLPDVALPRTQRRGIRRIRRSPQQIRQLLLSSGLETIDEWSPSSADHTFLARPQRS